VSRSRGSRVTPRKLRCELCRCPVGDGDEVMTVVFESGVNEVLLTAHRGCGWSFVEFVRSEVE
jgi:hypothetical protein